MRRPQPRSQPPLQLRQADNTDATEHRDTVCGAGGADEGSVTSFTYPDSFTATGLVAEFGLPYEARPAKPRGPSSSCRLVWYGTRLARSG
jgi:hypothetical protein